MKQSFARKRFPAVLWLTLLPIIIGCAANQMVLVMSTPPGAMIIVDEEVRGVTPSPVSIKPASEVSVRLEKDGYEPSEVLLTSTRSVKSFLISLPFGAAGIGLASLLYPGRSPEETKHMFIGAFGLFSIGAFFQFIVLKGELEPNRIEVELSKVRQ